MMKQLLSLFCLLTSLSAFPQEASDSARWDAELEDSVSAMAIKPVEHPEVLLMQTLERLEKDIKQKHTRREYKIEAIFNVRMPPVLNVDCMFSVQGDNGIDIMEPEYLVERVPMHFEGPFRITVADSVDVEFAISTSYSNTLHLEHKHIRWKYMDISSALTNYPVVKVYEGLLNVYDITVYSITDEKGRGIYRIHLDERIPRSERDKLFYNNHKMKWYLDSQTLRLVQINSYSSGNGYQTIYRHDFSEENGSPILAKAVQVSAWGGNVMHKVCIQLLDKNQSPHNSGQTIQEKSRDNANSQEE